MLPSPCRRRELLPIADEEEGRPVVRMGVGGLAVGRERPARGRGHSGSGSAAPGDARLADVSAMQQGELRGPKRRALVELQDGAGAVEALHQKARRVVGDLPEAGEDGPRPGLLGGYRDALHLRPVLVRLACFSASSS